MREDWPTIPAGTVLSLRHRGKKGDQKQWIVSDEGRGLSMRSSWLDASNSWVHEEPETGFKDLAEVLARIPELRTVRRGTISEYTVDPAVMDPTILVGLLEASAKGGPEVSADWPEEVAETWAEGDSYIDDWGTSFPWVPRWAQINDIRVSTIDLGLANEPALQPVLVDEGQEQLVTMRDIVTSDWHSESGGAPISWSGGNKLSLLSPGLGYNQPWGDADELGPVYPFPRLPDEPTKLGEALVPWVIGTDSQVAAALALEPLDPEDELGISEREAWNERVAGVTISFELDADAQVQRSLREDLGRSSELYRRTRDGLARPHSREGEALAAALDDALDTGVIGGLTSGAWGE